MIQYYSRALVLQFWSEDTQERRLLTVNFEELCLIQLICFGCVSAVARRCGERGASFLRVK